MAKAKEDREQEELTVSVVIPVFNEEVTVGNIVTRAKKTLEQLGVSYEILVVDDGSVDKSAHIAQEMKAHVLKEAHQGKGFALRSGFRQAKGELVVTLDADGSHQPEEIPLVLKHLRENKADFVVGSRFLNSKVNQTKIPKINRTGNRIFNDLIGYLSGVQISDSQSGFRAIRSSLIKRMKLSSHGYEVESEMLVKALRMGARVAEIPISFVQRTVGTSKLDPIKDGVKIFHAIITSYLS
ncbi:MAG: glycosyltransferase family 2 protein [Candidatus Bathyarchaeota archaeon]|jgi:glycosyltransferase involved in cell wall biosynthesis